MWLDGIRVRSVSVPASAAVSLPRELCRPANSPHRQRTGAPSGVRACAAAERGQGRGARSHQVGSSHMHCKSLRGSSTSHRSPPAAPHPAARACSPVSSWRKRRRASGSRTASSARDTRAVCGGKAAARAQASGSASPALQATRLSSSHACRPLQPAAASVPGAPPCQPGSRPGDRTSPERCGWATGSAL